MIYLTELIGKAAYKAGGFAGLNAESATLEPPQPAPSPLTRVVCIDSKVFSDATNQWRGGRDEYGGREADGS